MTGLFPCLHTTRGPFPFVEMEEYLLRFFIGGLAVSAFAVLGDIFRPKSFAGLFGAAPSIALCTIALAFSSHGGRYVMVEGRSMIIGAVGLFFYGVCVCWLMQRGKMRALPATVISLIVWAIVAVGGWAALANFS